MIIFCEVHRIERSPTIFPLMREKRGFSMMLILLLMLVSLTSVVNSQCSNTEGRGDTSSCVCDNKTVTCSNAGLTLLPEDVQASVLLINVSSNSIANLGENALVKFQKLEIIVLSDNQLTGVTSGAFSNLPALKQLYLDGNSLTTLEEISNVPNLQTIDISRNPIICDDKLKWLASIQQVKGTCKSGETIAEFIANTKRNAMNDTDNNHSKDDHHPSAARIYAVSIVLPILLVAFVCTVFVAIIVYRNKLKEAKYNSSVRYSAVQKDRGGGRVYDDVTTEL
ncbi:uncharacterized protein [Amphiura filiformis]|uniref:uncharacterized protein n=1 Tax=Amphiura filiformis TaxID=82378 RepID=UPI003B20F82B